MSTNYKGVNLKLVKNSSLIPGYITIPNAKSNFVNNTDSK